MSEHNTRRTNFNQILSDLTQFYAEESRFYLQLLVEKGVSVNEIAKRRGVRPFALRNRLGLNRKAGK